jgi:hypothetical protein
MASDEFLDQMLSDLLTSKERDPVKTIQHILRSFANEQKTQSPPQPIGSFHFKEENLDDMISYLLNSKDTPKKTMQHLLRLASSDFEMSHDAIKE